MRGQLVPKKSAKGTLWLVRMTVSPQPERAGCPGITRVYSDCGLVKRRDEDGRYEITQTGRNYLAEWMRER